MLLAFTAVSFWAAYAAKSARDIRTAVDLVSAAGGVIRFRHQSTVAEPNHNAFSSSSLFDLKLPPPGPVWLRHFIGDEYFQSVVYIDLEGREVSRELCAALSNLHELRYLNLAYTNVDDDHLKFLEDLERLQVLYLDRNSITDAGFKHLSQLQRLESVVLNSLPIDGSGLTHLAELRELKRISLQYTQIESAEYVHLSKMQGLEELFLSCSSTGDDDLRHVARLKNLIQLGIDRTNISSEGMAHLTSLPKLAHLYVNEEVAVKATEQLRRMPSLEAISLEPSPEIESGPEKLNQALPGCKIYRW